MINSIKKIKLSSVRIMLGPLLRFALLIRLGAERGGQENWHLIDVRTILRALIITAGL